MSTVVDVETVNAEFVSKLREATILHLRNTARGKDSKASATLLTHLISVFQKNAHTKPWVDAHFKTYVHGLTNITHMRSKLAVRFTAEGRTACEVAATELFLSMDKLKKEALLRG